MPDRQMRRATGAGAKVSGAGVAVDSYGGPAIDPTENVLALVDAERHHRDELRFADIRFQDSMREAETRRLNELALQKNTFDLEMARVLRANLDAASLLLATQLKEVKTDLQMEIRGLNQFRWESGGKTSGRDDVWKYIFAAAAAGATLTVIANFLLKTAS